MHLLDHSVTDTAEQYHESPLATSYASVFLQVYWRLLLSPSRQLLLPSIIAWEP